MMGKTHRAGGMLCALGGYVLLEKNGMLLNDVNPMLQLVVMYPFALCGSTISDQDQNWHAAPMKDIFGYVVNRLLHLTTGLRKKEEDLGRKPGKALSIFDAKHRSWQTHSDLFLILAIYLSTIVINSSQTSVDSSILKLVSIGLLLGIVSHLVLDMVTPEGIWSILLVGLAKILSLITGKKPNYKNCMLHLVPSSSFFATGGKWETLIRYILWVSCFLVIIYIAYEKLSPYVVNFNFI